MKLFLLLTSVVLLSSCSPPTKQDALKYYGKIRFQICSDILYRMDEQSRILNEYTNDPGKLTDGPTTQEHTQLLAEQERIIVDAKSVLETLETIDLLGDDAEYLENLKIFLYTRLNFERDVMLKFVKTLKDGMTPEESTFLGNATSQLLDLKKQQEIYLGAEELFLDEFEIGDADLDALIEEFLI